MCLGPCKAEHHDMEHIAKQSCSPHRGEKGREGGKESPGHPSLLGGGTLPPARSYLSFPSPVSGLVSYDSISE